MDLVFAYFIVGALIWMGMDSRGHIAKGFDQSAAAFGEPTSLVVGVIATIAAIVLWPLFVVAWLRQLRGRG